MQTIRGQDRAVALLRDQLAADRLHHAYIFHGPAGVGKFTTAVAFANILLGSDRDDASHPDLHVVTKELAAFSDDATVRNRKLRNIPVGVVRTALIEPVHRAASVPGGRKMFIVDEAELLDRTGQNAMLKTLEEPPKGTVIILVTTSEDRLLPTVRSRCQRIAFNRLRDDVVRDWLPPPPEVGVEDREAVVTFAQGSLGRAQLAIDYNLTAWVTRVLPGVDKLARGEADPRLGGDIHQFIDTFAAAWVEKHKAQNASKEAANQMGANLMYAMLADHAAARLREADDPEPWLGVIDAIERSRGHLASNLNASLVADDLAAQLADALQGATR